MWQSHSAFGRARLIRGSTASTQLFQVHVHARVEVSSETHACNSKEHNRESVWFHPNQWQIVYP